METDKEGIVVATLTEKKVLTLGTIQSITHELEVLLGFANKSKKLVVNFAEVEFMTTTMIGALMRFDEQATNRNIRYAFCALQLQMMQVLTISQLRRHFPIRRDVTSACRFVKTEDESCR
ncbi:MAG: STAS domain-containing protein [Candidatus Peregrinibacteria bacterium]|nr:STAS domain-containing protein [Candidatus Peregrinibacteria bacterium]